MSSGNNRQADQGTSAVREGYASTMSPLVVDFNPNTNFFSVSLFRYRHQIDVKSLETYLSEKIPGFKAPLDVSQFSFGQSNPTYLLADAK